MKTNKKQIKMLFMILLLGACKGGNSGSAKFGSKDGEKDLKLQITEETTLAEILCAKKIEYDCDSRVFIVGGIPSIACAWDDSIDYMGGENSKRAAVLTVAESIKEDLEAASITFSEDLTYSNDDRDESVYDSKVIDSDNGEDIHIALDWSNDAYMQSDGSGPLSAQALWLQVQNEDLLENIGNCGDE